MVDHLENGLQYANDRAVGAIHAFVEPAQPVEVTEEFVRAVNQMHYHRVRISRRNRVKRSFLRGRSDGRALPRGAKPFTPLVGAVDEVDDHFVITLDIMESRALQ